MANSTAVKQALARLADGPPDDESVVERAVRVRTDLEAADRFVDSGGVDRLRCAVERRGEGYDALAAFERYRRACQFGRGRPDRDQFHSGHATDLPAAPKDTSD